jgi:exopolysaccharide biosynthesis protein
MKKFSQSYTGEKMKLQVDAYKRGFLIFVLFVLSVPVYTFAQNFQTVRDGIEHAKITRQMKSADGKDESVVFNLLRLDLREVRLDVVHAFDRAIGLEKTSSIAARHGAIAAINAGFFRLDKSIFAGDAAGVLMIDRKLLSESVNNRIALFISNKKKQTEVNFAHLNINDSLRIKKKDFLFSGINRQRKENELIEFTSRLQRKNH